MFHSVCTPGKKQSLPWALQVKIEKAEEGVETRANFLLIFRAGRIRLGKAKPPHEAREGISSCVMKIFPILRLAGLTCFTFQRFLIQNHSCLWLTSTRGEFRQHSHHPAKKHKKHQRWITYKNDPFILFFFLFFPDKGENLSSSAHNPAHLSTQRHSSPRGPACRGHTEPDRVEPTGAQLCSFNYTSYGWER